jgi:protein-tyrosine phosphatase
MAEGLLKQALPGKEVCSAGISAMVGEPAASASIQLMRECGIDISGHRAQNLASWMVNEADIILTMDLYQMRFIEATYAASKGKVFRLGEFGKYDIPDPYRQGLATFRHSYGLIARGIDELIDHIAYPGKDGNQYVLTPIRESPLPFSP